MAIGDRVVIGDRYYWKESDGGKVMAYMPKLGQDGQWILAPDQKSVVVESVGGVQVGSIGVVDGNIIHVQRGYIKGMNERGFGVSDIVELVPVNLEKYQRVGYFLIENIRIFGG